MNMNSESLKPKSDRQHPNNDSGFSIKMNPKSSKAVLIFAIGLLCAFLLPWVRWVFKSNLPGYNLYPLGSVGYYVWIIPFLAGATILVSFLGINNRIIGALTGIVPITAILYTLIKIIDTGSIGEWRLVVEQFFLIGIKLTFVLSIAIIISANVGSPYVQKKAVKDEKQDGELHSAETGGKKKYAIVASLLNYLWAGVGNIYLGQKTKGTVFFGITLLIILFIIFYRYAINIKILMLIHTLYTLVMIIDAVLLSGRIKKGEVVKEWDFFRFGKGLN